MKSTLLSIFYLFPFILYSQAPNYPNSTKQELKNLDSNYYMTNNNIYRVTIGVPLETLLSGYVPDVMIMGNYERKLSKQISFVGNLGIRMCNKSYGVYYPEPVSSYHLAGTGEIRYYYALGKRKRNVRPTMNFSGGYVSVNQYFLANPFAITSSNKQVSEADAVQSQASLYFNIGYQRQYKNLFFNVFLGVLLSNQTDADLKDFGRGSLPGGVSIGYVF
jgi:hypothetical protein